MEPVYFDHAATTPLDERVLEEMLPWLTTEYGNASSIHSVGQSAKVALEEARERVAGLIGAEPSEIIFTSGGTESNNAAIQGAFKENSAQKNRLITSPVEHHSVVHTAESLQHRDVESVFLKPGKEGRITARQVEKALNEKTLLVSLMHVNNELGTINPIQEIAGVCRPGGVLLHSDCVQSAGKLPLDVKELGVDLLSMSAHKFYGPKGVGTLYVRTGSPWAPLLYGGSQERNRRGGTSNLPGIVGLARALELAVAEMEEHRALYLRLRDRLISNLDHHFGGEYRLNSPLEESVPNIVNFGFPGIAGSSAIDGEMLLLNLDIEGVCVSSGSACTSGAVEPSHVLTGIGLDKKTADTSLRVSFGKNNTPEEVDLFTDKLQAVLRRMAPAV